MPVANADARRRAPRRGGARSWRAARIVAVVLSAVVVFVTGTVYAGAQHFAGKIRRIDNALPGGPRPAESAAGSENFLLVGSDNRDQLTPALQRKYHLGHDAGRRSDTMIILHVSKQRDRAVLISLPRDSYVEIPAYTDDQGVHHPAQHNKLNAAYSFGGAQLAVRTVEKATGIRIDHYVEINVLGFASMVDALGGIDVCVPQAVNDPKSGLHLPAGKSHVGGVQGLAFVRARYTLGDGSDLGRIKRQQQFLGSMLRKAESVGILLDPAKLNRFLDAALSAVQVDRDLSFGDLRTLALTMRHLDPHHVTFLTVPLSNTNYQPGGVGSTVLWDPTLSQALFSAINHDDSITPATFKPHRPTVPPSQVTLQVQNGTTVGGLASQVSNALAAQGFRIGATPTNADNHSYATTTVRYPGAQLKAAQTVLAALPGATLQRDDSLSSMVVVLGANYTAVRQVNVASTAPKVPTTTASDNPCSG